MRAGTCRGGGMRTTDLVSSENPRVVGICRPVTQIPSMFTEIESQHEGSLHVYAQELSTGREWAYRPQLPVASASTIKLPILVHAALCVHKGLLSWDAPLTLREEDKVGGMGVLRNFRTPHALSLHDACYLMTAVSDNTATNLVIDLVGIDAVNGTVGRLGLRHTCLNRKAFAPDTDQSRPFGLGVTTAHDMGILLHEIWRPKLLPEAVADEVRQMLALQQDLVGIARVLPPGWIYSGKTGRTEEVRGDVGWVCAPDGREWILSLFCYGLSTVDWSIQNQGLLAIAQAAQNILGLARHEPP